MTSLPRSGPIDGSTGRSDAGATAFTSNGNGGNGIRHNHYLFDIRISEVGRDSRDRIFELCFMRIGLWYSSIFPPMWRKAIEFALLASALSALAALVYLHLTFFHSPVTCLSNHNWTEDGILRIESNSHSLEYSLEYGLLKLSNKTRVKLKVPVEVIHLDPESDECFGSYWSRVLQRTLINTEDALMASLKTLAEKQERRGFVRNLDSGELYRFVNVQSTRFHYVSAAPVMFIFTFVITLLLRHSHYQVYTFVASFMEGNSFPSVASLLTIVLALLGMETIMAKFFGETTTAFYVILIVWAADQFNSMCRSRLTRRHWPRFFFLYHFAFYAYEYRFSSQHSGLALFTSWLLTLHSMVCFVHRCELPQLVNMASLLSSASSSFNSPSSPHSATSYPSSQATSAHQSMQEGEEEEEEGEEDNSRGHSLTSESVSTSSHLESNVAAATAAAANLRSSRDCIVR